MFDTNHSCSVLQSIDDSFGNLNQDWNKSYLFDSTQIQNCFTSTTVAPQSTTNLITTGAATTGAATTLVLQIRLLLVRLLQVRSYYWCATTGAATTNLVTTWCSYCICYTPFLSESDSSTIIFEVAVSGGKYFT